MTIEQFINGITFSGILPTDSGIVLVSNQTDFPHVCDADLRITKLPYDNDYYHTVLTEVCLTPRMATFAIGAIINHIVRQLDDSLSYVNVGVWNGFSFLAGMAGNPHKRCVGIDNFSEFGGPQREFRERFLRMNSEHHTFFDLDYRKYLEQEHQGEIGFYFYDGNHSRENQRNGLAQAEPFFSQNCIVMVDDCNTEEALLGTADFLQMSKNKYQLLFQQNTAHNLHPTFWNGLIVLQRVAD